MVVQTAALMVGPKAVPWAECLAALMAAKMVESKVHCLVKKKAAYLVDW